MLDGLIGSVSTALQAAGLPAGPAYPKTGADLGQSYVAVGLEKVAGGSAGFARYLGLRVDAETGAHEVYGLRCDVDVGLDIYVPLSADNAAVGCIAAFDSAAAVIGGLAGLRVKALSCGAPEPDRETGMFRLHGCVSCSAFLVLPENGESGSFTDFILRGELQT